jgi:hypothetical protein
MIGKAARIGIVAALVTVFGLATAAQAQEVHRIVWQYDGGFFKDQGLGNWVEKNWSGTYHFREVHRNREFVELYDGSRDVTVRLYWDVSLIQWGTHDPARPHDFARLYGGRWGA